MINKASTNYAGNSGKVSFGHNFDKTRKLIITRLVDPAAKNIDKPAIVEDTLVTLGRKVEHEFPQFSKAISKDPHPQLMREPEAALLLQEWNYRNIAQNFITEHLKSISKSAIQISSKISSKIPVLNLINHKKMKKIGVAVVGNRKKKTVEFSDAFVKKYVKACESTVKNDFSLSTLYKRFLPNHKK